MHTYRNTGTNPLRSFEVGYWLGEEFKILSRHSTAVKARRRVNYLNGGSVPSSAAPSAAYGEAAGDVQG